MPLYCHAQRLILNVYSIVCNYAIYHFQQCSVAGWFQLAVGDIVMKSLVLYTRGSQTFANDPSPPPHPFQTALAFGQGHPLQTHR